MMSSRHESILTSNRLLLVRRLKVTGTLLACLRQDYTLTDEMQQEIEAEKTDSRKASTLLDTLMRRGDKAFDRLIYALVETDQDELALALDGDLAQPYIDKRNSTRVVYTQSNFRNDSVPGSTGGHQAPFMIMNPGGPIYHQPGIQYPMQMISSQTYVIQAPGFVMTQGNMQPGANVSIPWTVVAQPSDSTDSQVTYSKEELQRIMVEIDDQQSESAEPIMNFKILTSVNTHLAKDENSMVYPIKHSPRGRAVIISNRYFITVKFGNRDGAEHDIENLTNLFQQLDFSVIPMENLEAKQIRAFLEEESRHPDHCNADMFVLVLMSHGNMGKIYGIDGKPLSIEEDITALFSPEKCPALKGKPKVFFIQACQGNLTTPGYATDSDKWEPLKDKDLDENMIKEMKELSLVDKEGFVPGYHKKSDMVMSYATVKGYKAWRRSDLGSWFVRCLVSVFSRRAHCAHLLDMLTETNFLLSKLKTSKADGHCIQLAEKTDTLTKKLYFFPTGSVSARKPVN